MTQAFVGDSENAKEAREWLVGVLQEYPMEVTFTKKDGTERVMLCTLQEEYLPETVGDVRKKSEDSLAVYDLENEGWRSFRWDSIKAVKFTLGD